MNADPQPEVVEEPIEAAPEVVEPAAVEVVATPVDDSKPWFAGVEKLIESSFTGDVDGAQYGEMLAKMTPEDIENMPPAAKAIMRGFVDHVRAESAKSTATLAADRKAIADDRAKAQAEGARITREGAQLNALLTSPEIRRLRDSKVPEKPDLATDAGRKAYFDALIGARINDTFAPVLDRAQMLTGQAAFLDLQDRMPELKDTKPVPELGRTLLAEVEARQIALETAKQPVPDTESMALRILGEVGRKRTAAAIQTNRAAAAAAAQNIQRAGVGGGRQAPKEIPREVIANKTIGEWLAANPDYRPAS